MPKYVPIALVAIVVLAALYFVFLNKRVTPVNVQQNTPVSQNQTPPTFGPNDDSDAAVDSDMTALERELTEIDSYVDGFSNEYQGI